MSSDVRWYSHRAAIRISHVLDKKIEDKTIESYIEAYQLINFRYLHEVYSSRTIIEMLVNKQPTVNSNTSSIQY